ncbi:NAD-dependent epimerase/dehydratase family protein [Streptomyces sp. NPDC050504]|uniref:NAD-dependent epimerase/dehydratase family protein n=1 Tax=Streptomyces sp. NPDC050504 TaxID=3365618 RepID=UPI0037B86594
MARRRVLVIGSTGFVGSRVVARLTAPGRDDADPVVRVLLHRRGVRQELVRSGAVETVRGDLAHPSTLRGICDGVDTVLHLASLIGGDQEECRTVNDAGTRALLAEAARAGVSRIVQLGTTAVYRDGVHRGAAEGELPFGPASVTSVTRLAGERQVLAAGGVVVRPHLVFGPGDTWVVPSLVRLLTAVPHWVDGARARLSLIHVDDLAWALTELAGRPALPSGSALHAAHPRPVRVRELLSAVAHGLALPQPRGSVRSADALELLGAGPDEAVWRRRLDSLTTDRWYDSSRLWQLLGSCPAEEFGARFADALPWYRRHLPPDHPA